MYLNFKTIENIKSLEGIKTSDGKAIKKNSFFRSADLHNLNKEELDILKTKYNLKTVIDFRSDISFENKKDRLDESISLYHIRALEYLNYTPYNKNIPLPPVEFFMDIYKRLAISEDGINTYKKFFKVILNSKEGSILYHCTSGKDRTGIATDLLLYVLGCSMETIYEEHLSVNVYQEKIFNDFIKTYKFKDDEDEIFYRTYYFAKKEYLDYFFKSIIDKFGSIDNYLFKGLDLSKNDIEYLKEKYLE